MKKKKKVGMVLEGGGMRGMFTAGVLDVMMENDIEIDGIVGTSAGALFGVNYFSKQPGRALRYNKRFCGSPRYISKTSFFFTGNIINRKFAYYKVPFELDKFDDVTYEASGKEFYAVATDVETGEAKYFKIENCRRDIEKLRASGAVPLASKIVKIDGGKYLDGGVADSIPLAKVQQLGYEKIIVILTQPLDYRKKAQGKKTMAVVSKKYKKYPEFVERIRNRHTEYNEAVQKVAELEKKKEIFVIRPQQAINIPIMVKDPDELQRVYDMGVEEGKKILKDLKAYLKR